MEEVKASSKQDDKWELEGLIRAIKEVEMAKANKPDLYKKALSQLKGEVKVISSLADLKKLKVEKEEEESNEEE